MRKPHVTGEFVLSRGADRIVPHQKMLAGFVISPIALVLDQSKSGVCCSCQLEKPPLAFAKIYLDYGLALEVARLACLILVPQQCIQL